MQIENYRQRIIENTHYESDEVRLVSESNTLRIVDYSGLNLYISPNNDTLDISGSVDGIKIVFTNWTENKLLSALQNTNFFTKYKRLSRLLSQKQLYCEKV